MNNNKRVWIIDDDKSIRWVLEKSLQQAGLDTRTFSSGDSALRSLDQIADQIQQQPAVIVSDIRMPGIDGLSLLQKLHERLPNLPVIIMTAHSDLDSTVAAYSGGAFDYLPKPFDIDEATAVTQRALTFSRENTTQIQQDNPSKSPEIIGEAPAMQEVFRAIGRLSQSNISVLINGESGTGKELVAQALHRHSPRQTQAFIALNMAAIPQDLIESELFGHEKGAFTGAAHLRQGRFEQAHGGTLFLDEIGDMPADTQTRLLRVLADSEFFRVGGHIPVKVDVRIIAATHQNLENLVATGRFREDLFHRLNVIRIHLPKLSERREDIPKLSEFFLLKAARELGVENKILLPDALEFLRLQSWPGNVRQLENTCRWITVMASGREVHIDDLPAELRQASSADLDLDNWPQALQLWADKALAAGQTEILKQAMPLFERAMIDAALKHTAGHKRDAAEILGWGRNTLTRKLKELEEQTHRA